MMMMAGNEDDGGATGASFLLVDHRQILVGKIQ